MIVLLLLAAAPVSASDEPGLDPRAEACVSRFEAAWSKVRTLRFNMVKRERLRNGRVIKEEIGVKLRRPKTLYVAQLRPRRGQEAIYDPARDRDEVLAHPGRFPDFTVSLDLYGSYATKDQHHPVDHIGYDYTLGVVRTLIGWAQSAKYGERFEYLGSVERDGEVLEHVRFVGGKAPWRHVTARDDESVFDLAKRVGADPYLIYYYNRSLDDYSDELDEGTSYRIPPYYSPSLDLWFSSRSQLLVRMEAKDYEGRRYEDYRYTNMAVNPRLTDRDFDPDNPEYNF
ncbi:MAG: DUF1571 domain-containing protein [Myxococcota bacterium]